tara:strand:- start:1483 stop:2196 length:714 start_codon:yes stop_codon:yes gene_type:complete
MKLTTLQIEDLFKFTRKHFVYHYDVQSELVDHLANDIEEIWKETPQLSFQDARDTSFKKFGIFGFMDVIEAKQKQMNKRYRSILWRFFREWFTMPKMMTTLTVFLSLYLILKIQYSEYFLLGALFLILAVDLIKQTKARKTQKKKEQKQEKVFLLEAMIGNTRQGFATYGFFQLFNFLISVVDNVEFSNLPAHWLLLTSFSATALLILFYVTAYLIPQKAEELLEETYPEYKLVKNL